MDLAIKGHLALITGSTSGHGKALAKILLEEGARVVVNSFSDEELDQVRDEMSALGEVFFIRADVTKNDEVTHMMDEIYKIGELDILVNNVGYWRDDDFWDITDELWDRMFQLNFYGTVRTMRYALPKMLKRNYGRIVNVASEIAFKPSGAQAHYSVCKTAVVSLTRAAAQTCRGKDVNVRINSVLPGGMLTPTEINWHKEVVAQKGVDYDEYVDNFIVTAEPTTLVQRYLQPEEVARVVAFYLSPLTTPTMGTAIIADGGMIHHI